MNSNRTARSKRHYGQEDDEDEQEYNNKDRTRGTAAKAEAKRRQEVRQLKQLQSV